MYNTDKRAWGTVCGHGYWDNNNAADIVCRAQGFAYGTIYTYGTSAALPNLPVVAGYKICMGLEQTLFDCEQVHISRVCSIELIFSRA